MALVAASVSPTPPPARVLIVVKAAAAGEGRTRRAARRRATAAGAPLLRGTVTWNVELVPWECPYGLGSLPEIFAAGSRFPA